MELNIVSAVMYSHLDQVCTYDETKKRKSVHVFLFFFSLASLAYNKGTALFGGNDPLQRSAAETWSLIINTPNMLNAAQERGRVDRSMCGVTSLFIKRQRGLHAL